MAELTQSTINVTNSRTLSKVNPDIQKERDSASFSPNDLTLLLYGGARAVNRRRELINKLFEDPVFNQEVKYHQSKSERYENTIMKSMRMVEYVIDKGWSQEDLQMASGAINYDLAIAVHAVMFIPAIERLGTPEQQTKWLPPAITMQVIGTYAQTELGHGTNLKALETTATYDPASECFILNTPLPSGMKWWPGGLGKTTSHAIVTAQLYVKGQNCGFQAFIVQLRDTETHLPLKGVEVGDIGPRISLGITDNGYLILDNVKVPRENMLARYSKVTPEGKFIRQAGTEKVNYGPMMLVRANIVMYAFETIAQAVTIATRYASVRRQSEMKPGEREPQILDYLTQQYKLLPNIAVAYSAFFTQRYMLNYYHKTFREEIERNNFKSVPELHSQSAGLKAYCTDLAMEGTEVCRRSCGGHGFLMASGLCSLLTDGLGSVTYEGENTVLYLQTARFLMKNFANARSGEAPARSVSYLEREPEGPCHIKTEADCLNLLLLKQAFHTRAYFMIGTAAKRLQTQLESGLPQYLAWNNNSVDLVRAAKAHLDSFVAVNFMDSLDELDVKPEVKRVLTRLCQLHALHRIVVSSGEFLESEAISPRQLELIKVTELKLLPEIRPDAVALVDAFDWHDETLNSALGRYDGNVYEKMYELAKNGPLNKESVHPSYYKYIKPLQKKAKL